MISNVVEAFGTIGNHCINFVFTVISLSDTTRAACKIRDSDSDQF